MGLHPSNYTDKERRQIRFFLRYVAVVIGMVVVTLLVLALLSPPIQ